MRFSSVCSPQLNQLVLWTLCYHGPAIGPGLVGRSHKKISDLEDQVACSAIANRYQMARAEAIEGRHTEPIKWNIQPFRSLPAVGVGHQQVGIRRALLQVLQIADQDFIRRYGLEHGRGRRSHRGCNTAAHLGEKTGYAPQK